MPDSNFLSVFLLVVFVLCIAFFGCGYGLLR